MHVRASLAGGGLLTSTRREPIPGGSIINFIHEVYPVDQLRCSNSLQANLSASWPATVDLE
jgi:hypothetical protein